LSTAGTVPRFVRVTRKARSPPAVTDDGTDSVTNAACGSYTGVAGGTGTNAKALKVEPELG
jgi:hypothetical protein